MQPFHPHPRHFNPGAATIRLISMKAVIQRVGRAAVSIDGDRVAGIGAGLVVLLGVAAGDDTSDADYVTGKLSRLRIFADEDDRMNLSVSDVGGAILLVSQFTLLASTHRGNRPGFTDAAEPQLAEELYELVATQLRRDGITVETGRFGATMAVELLNDGPVTILLDSR